MSRGNKTCFYILAALSLTVGVGLTSQANANRFESPNYIIDASVGNNFGGTSNSSSYQLVSSGGETIVGDGAGGSYIMGEGYVAQLEQSLELNIQPAGLAAYYPMDEATGTAIIDNSSNSNDGSVGSGINWQSGKADSSLQFDGTAQHVTVPHDSSLDSADLTVMSWVKLDTALASQPKSYIGLVSNRASNLGFAMYLFKTQQELQVSIGDGITRTIYDPSVSSVDWTQWHHVAFTIEAQELVIYIDGQEIGRLTLSHGHSPSSNELWIGDITDYPNSSPDGQIDEVKLFTRALSPAEIQADYDSQNSGLGSGVSFGNIIPGVSSTAGVDAIVRTDAPGYTLGLHQNSDLQKGADTIPSIAGSIASPLAWTEGSTQGLGFTLVNTNATAIPAKWSGGSAYSALPSTSMSFYTRDNFSGGGKDLVGLRFKLSVDETQPSGNYSNVITWTGVMLP